MTAEALHLPRPSFGRGQAHEVAGCCFVASFAALGPPAGVAAAVGSARFGPAAPVLTGGAAAAVTVLAVTFPPLKFRTRWSR
ncbi:hypothetical protein [Streptomyces sp. V4I2]|uniref:hypothetical protein n=1 Tax=Streptomyces sp. V4I2 TaxID=3042280 RepID=UPI002783CAF3|nr:hypothetical protein [Streptomyces sp. V4I2]MDQ1050616.1 hypothetical protein [Streptomyces sp. V4I2]